MGHEEDVARLREQSAAAHGRLVEIEERQARRLAEFERVKDQDVSSAARVAAFDALVAVRSEQLDASIEHGRLIIQLQRRESRTRYVLGGIPESAGYLAAITPIAAAGAAVAREAIRQRGETKREELRQNGETTRTALTGETAPKREPQPPTDEPKS